MGAKRTGRRKGASPARRRAETPTACRRSARSYTVFSQRSGRRYGVKKTPEHGWSCTCGRYRGRGTYCKHIRAAEDASGIRRLRGGRRAVVGRVDAVVCRNGCAGGVIKKGRAPRAGGMVQQYGCKVCGARFVARLGFRRMRTPDVIIGAALNMYFNGESYRGVAETLGTLGYPITHKAVEKWVSKYVPLIGAFLDSIRPRLSGRWRIDEMHVTVGGRRMYLYAIIDDESRFWISVQMAPTKNTADIRPLMRRSMRLAGRNPEALTSDAAPNIKKACDDVYRAPGLARKTDHERHIHFNGDRNNNKSESFNGGVREREKTMRSIKRPDSPVIEGMRIHHNTKSHMGLDGISPCDRIGIVIEGDNKWVTLIQNAEKQRIEKRTEKRKKRANAGQRSRQKRSTQKKPRKPRSR